MNRAARLGVHGAMLRVSHVFSLAALLPLFAACALEPTEWPAAPPAMPIEVVAPAPAPSLALDEQLAKGEDDFVLFDVGYAVRDACVRMQTTWLTLEFQRSTALRELLQRVSAGSADPHGSDSHVADVADVALNLWHGVDPETLPDMPPGPRREERDEVFHGARGKLRFGAHEREVEWRRATAPGSFETAADQDGELPSLQRVTVYLQEYLMAWPAEQRNAWHRAITAALTPRLQQDLRRIDAALLNCFGTEALMPGIVGVAAMPDVARLRGASSRADVWRTLADALAPAPTTTARNLRDGVLAVASALYEAKADDAICSELTASQWQAKWRDVALFHYVALRQIDGQAIPLCESPLRRMPRLVIEPLPEVWAHLCELHRLQNRVEESLRDEPPAANEHSWLDDVCLALEYQNRGENVPHHLASSLLHVLRTAFTVTDEGLEQPVPIEGLPGAFRRAIPQLVRVPIQWRGQRRVALALRLFVEHEQAEMWNPPPWGVELLPAATARMEAPGVHR